MREFNAIFASAQPLCVWTRSVGSQGMPPLLAGQSFAGQIACIQTTTAVAPASGTPMARSPR
jgi:hypothetical protein